MDSEVKAAAKPRPEIVGPDYNPKWIASWSNADYHADKSAVSSTALRKVLKSPWTFFTEHVLDLYPRKAPTPAMEFGTNFHTALLEPDLFKKLAVIEPKFSGKGMKAAKEEWESSLPTGAVVLSKDDFDAIQEMLESVSRHEEAAFILKNSINERTGFFRDPASGILCKFRADFINPGLGVLGDLKTTTTCQADAFARAIHSRRYDIQLYFYCLGYEILTGQKITAPSYLVVETEPPYEVALYPAHDDLLVKAKRDCERALDVLGQCLKTDTWPRYQEKSQVINLPAYAFYE